MVTMFAAAELKRRICACRDINERLHDLQLDMALQSTETARPRLLPLTRTTPADAPGGAMVLVPTVWSY